MLFHSRLLTGGFKRDTITWRGTTMQRQTNEIDFREEKECFTGLYYACKWQKNSRRRTDGNGKNL